MMSMPRVLLSAMSLSLAVVLAIATGCKPRLDDSSLQSDASVEQELQAIRGRIDPSLHARIFEVPPTSASLPRSFASQAAPIGRMPGVIVGVVPNGGNSSYNKPAIDNFKVVMKRIFFERAQARQGLFFTVVAVDLQRFSRFTKGIARRTLTSQAQTEMDAGYRELPANLVSVFSRSTSELEKYVLILDDDVAWHQAQSPAVTTSYFETYRLPVRDEASADDPVPVTLVSRSGRLAIGPFHIPFEQSTIVSAFRGMLDAP